MGRTLYRLAAAVAVLGVSAVANPPAHADPAPLNGLFALSSGVCSNGAVTGSFFRMILPTGDAGGPYLQNSDSGCSDQTVTPLAAGTDGGLIAGDYQPQPDAAFDGSGNARSGRVTTPVRFYGVDFATATNPTDPQTGAGTGLPQILADGGQLSGDLSSLGVTWNNQVFNQGAPKPGGGLPGKTSPVRGSIDAAGNFVLEWTSQIVGGPFNNFTGLWHLAGQYRGGGLAQGAPAAQVVPAQPAAAPPAPGAPLAPVASPVPGAPAPAAPPAPGAPPAPAAPGGSPASGALPASGAPSAPGVQSVPGASAVPGAASGLTAPPAPGASPASGAPDVAGGNAAVAQGQPALAARTAELPGRRRDPVWLVPLLVVLAVVATGAFFSADRLTGRRRS
ncbi:hypothetical protein BJY24_003756 [Nocardia transvalensis]|uniref:Uncharacterized protein n=1 Tax=Nocardia transvalensis TaxID=37333 RepID=A0A7W9PEW8_9NOCA|nr:hypothetical protein [Nocardia transvalensis]MBB5914889.1 hypothetical protein [Nocardia transvalensis]